MKVQKDHWSSSNVVVFVFARVFSLEIPMDIYCLKTHTHTLSDLKVTCGLSALFSIVLVFM